MMQKRQQEERVSHLMEHPEGKGKQRFVKFLVGLLVLLSLALLLNQLGLKINMQDFLPKPKEVFDKEPSESSSSSSEESEDEDEIEEGVVSRSETPFTWTYEDYQDLDIGLVTMAEVEDKFGPANLVLKETEEFRSLTYREETDYDSAEYIPPRKISLNFKKRGEDYYLTYKEVQNMVFPFEPAPKDQRTFTWTKEKFEALPVPTYKEPDTGLSYEEIVATYGQPHRIWTEEAMTADISRQEMRVSYEESERDEDVDLSFKKAPDGKYRLRFKHGYGS